MERTSRGTKKKKKVKTNRKVWKILSNFWDELRSGKGEERRKI